jgi:hypothetical protein
MAGKFEDRAEVAKRPLDGKMALQFCCYWYQSASKLAP